MQRYYGYDDRLHGSIIEEKAYITACGHVIGEIIHRENDACEVEYIIRPYWDEYDKYKSQGVFWQEIPGINCVERRAEYIRDHLPTIIKQRVPPRGRGDIPYLMKKYGLENKTYDPWTFVCASHGVHNDCFNIFTEEDIKAGKNKNQ